MRSEGRLSRAPHVLRWNSLLHTTLQDGHQPPMEMAGQDLEHLEQMLSVRQNWQGISLLQVGAFEVVC